MLLSPLLGHLRIKTGVRPCQSKGQAVRNKKQVTTLGAASLWLLSGGLNIKLSLKDVSDPFACKSCMSLWAKRCMEAWCVRWKHLEGWENLTSSLCFTPKEAGCASLYLLCLKLGFKRERFIKSINTHVRSTVLICSLVRSQFWLCPLSLFSLSPPFAKEMR